MRRPSFQFYPADWRNNANLRRCSPAARGVWIDVMCVLHDSDDYGIVHWPLADLANSANASIKLVRELVDKGVLKGIDTGQAQPYIYVPRSGRRDGKPVTLVSAQEGPLWYSSRMLKDEYVRLTSGVATRYGSTGKPAQPQDGKPISDTLPDEITPPNPSPTRRLGDDQGDDQGAYLGAVQGEYQGDGSTSSSSSTPTVIRSVAKATGDESPIPPPINPPKPPPVKLPADMTKAELWSAGRSILMQANMPEAQCRSFIGKLAKDYGNDVAVEAVRSAIFEQPVDPVSYLKACCQHASGQRKSTMAERTANFFNDDAAQPERKNQGSNHVTAHTRLADVIDIESRCVG